jgi:hypothetical protein
MTPAAEEIAGLVGLVLLLPFHVYSIKASIAIEKY